MTTPNAPIGFLNRFFSGPGVVLLIPYAIIGIICFLVYALFMALLVRLVCLIRGRYVIFVHSNSPVWQEYIATRILPRLPPGAVILNWSDHLKWKRLSYPVLLFRRYGGDANFNPMGIVCTPVRGVRTFRFWQAFTDFKHGNDKPLKDMEDQFFAYLDETTPRWLRAMESQSGELSLSDGVISYRNDRVNWTVKLSDVRLIGEYTTANGPYVDDYFFVFLTAPENGWHEASFYAKGRDAFLSTIGKELETAIETGLCNSAEYKTRIMWPSHLKGQPLMQIVPKTTRRGRFGDKISGSQDIVLSDPARTAFRDRNRITRAVELHDSTIGSITRGNDGRIDVLFSPAYVHESEGKVGFNKGTGWVQSARMTLTNASVSGSEPTYPQNISDGNLCSDGKTMDNLIPIPFAGKDIQLTVVFTTGDKVTITAKTADLQPEGVAKYVEEFEP